MVVMLKSLVEDRIDKHTQAGINLCIDLIIRY